MFEELKAELDSGRIAGLAPRQQIPAEWMIARAEDRLGVKFPPSYRWWLETYGGGGFNEFGSEEVLTIPPMAFEGTEDIACTEDIVYYNETSAANGMAIANGLIVYAPDDELYYFDLSSPSMSGEYPVMRWDMESGTTEQFAPSFDEFMLKEIRRRFR